MAFVKDTREAEPPVPFDIRGFLLLALGLSTLLGAMEISGKALAPGWVSWLATVIGSLALWAYYVQSRQKEHPIIDLTILRFRTYRTNILGGTPLRIANGASPFLLPLMLQLGFGLSPLASMGSPCGVRVIGRSK